VFDNSQSTMDKSRNYKCLVLLWCAFVSGSTGLVKITILRGSGGLGYFTKSAYCKVLKPEKIDEARVLAKVQLKGRLASSYINILLYISNSVI